MSYKGRIGDVVESGRCDGDISSFEWKIPDFLSLACEGGDFYQSPVFNACDGRWCLKIYLKGLRRTPDWVSLHLFRADSGPPKTLNAKLGIRGPEGVYNKKEIAKEFSTDDPACYWYQLCRRSELTEQNSRLMPGNNLTLTLDMKSVMPSVARGVLSRPSSQEAPSNRSHSSEKRDACTQTDCNTEAEVCTGVEQSSEKRGCEKVVEDIAKLLTSGEDSDVTVRVGDVEFNVHRAILSARSPVLSAMFRHETEERASNSIKIDDCEPDVFGQYLQYLYTGSVQSLTEQTVFDLYRIADKYLAEELKQLCLEHIRATLSVQTFCEVVKLALTHGESDLLQLAINFAIKNISFIIISVEWQNFIRGFPTEANEILIKCFGPRS